MTLPTSHLAYEAEIAVLEQALNSSRGVRLPFRSFGDASTYRHRLHKARDVDRKRNMEVFEPGTELYGRSPYDPLICKIKPRDNLFYIYIEQNCLPSDIEEIPEDEPNDSGIALPPSDATGIDLPAQLTFRRR